MFIITEGFY